jgi:hypothetical protein
MDVDKFWDLIEKSRRGVTQDGDQIAENLTARLEKLDPEEIIGFEKILYDLIQQANRWDLWAVAYIIQGGCSDDGFLDFRGWLISRGRKCFEEAMINPESVGRRVTQEQAESDGIECQDILHVSQEAYTNKTGEAEMPDDDYEYDSEYGTVKGEQWNEEDLEKMYPKLCKKFFG